MTVSMKHEMVLLLVVLAAACSNTPPDDPKSYIETIASARKTKDDDFRTASNSPVPPGRRAEVLPLGYFPIDPDYRVAAELKPSNDNTVINMPTSTGEQAQFRRVGTLEFVLKGKPLKLTAFHEVGARTDTLFVPFTDLTTGTETYAAGRFMDLDPNATGIYQIDFNRAYFPYCFYSPTYSCPYPPIENRLQVPIRVGERFRKAKGES